MDKFLNKRVLLPIVILASGIAIMAAFASMKKPPEEKPTEQNIPWVEVKVNHPQNKQIYVRSQGEVKPKFETVLVAQVSGIIVELDARFEKGGFVQKGQTLAQIDPSDYQVALTQAQASLASAQALLEQEKAQGQVAKVEWQQIQDLEPSSLALRKPQLAQALAQVKAAKAAVQKAERDLQRTKIIAPFDAIVASRNISPGSFLSTGSQIGEIYATENAEIRLPIAESQLKFLQQKGVSAQVVLEAESGGQLQTFDATIVRSEGIKNSQSRMQYLVAQVDDPYALKSSKSSLEFGSYAVAKIHGQTVENASILARHLIKDGQVAILDANDQLAYRSVDILRVEDGQAIVTNGLFEGDRIIVSALQYPVEGMKLSTGNELQESKEQSDADTVLAQKD
ncbi:efflux RND transporter periplasmic adaptor subunit [Catenovulum sediminis]|uniref:efflux RND transporter periplasmic adaptor subunit n=1 Tax=Catenovulum sediminis TaxID=1740262 RepID=UPI00117EDD4D|nr:efflux RND transporter periplasmic adaptor subunit [Catenovulum sediminis]